MFEMGHILTSLLVLVYFEIIYYNSNVNVAIVVQEINYQIYSFISKLSLQIVELTTCYYIFQL